MKHATLNRICTIRCLVAVTRERFLQTMVDCGGQEIGRNGDHVGANGTSRLVVLAAPHPRQTRGAVVEVFRIGAPLKPLTCPRSKLPGSRVPHSGRK